MGETLSGPPFPGRRRGKERVQTARSVNNAIERFGRWRGPMILPDELLARGLGKGSG
jgi:hypothetical protein